MIPLPRKPLILRVDASTRIGSGHVMRCLALAQAWQDDGGHAVFVMAMDAPMLESRLKSEGMEVIHLVAQPGSVDDASRTADLARQMEARWVVVDGYHFRAFYQRIIKDSGFSLLYIDDDVHADHYHADLVLNQNLHANETLYVKREPYTQLLLGSRYILLRREFLAWGGWNREIPKIARKVVVTLGGADPNNVTLKAIQSLQHVEVEALEVVVVVGANNPHKRVLQDAIRQAKCCIRLEYNTTEMPELMIWADVAISAGGSTCWELAFLGLSSVVMALADNQCGIVAGLGEAGVALNLGWYTEVSSVDIAHALVRVLRDQELRQRMSQRGRRLVDGHGAERVVTFFHRYAKQPLG